MKRRLGVCYYPEHWPEDCWAGDARAMAACGLSLVRIGEFAWSRIEPAPGRFAWDWLDRAIGVLAAEGLGVVLGTPTATPPRWMLDRFPDMLAIDMRGRPRGFGARRHYDFAHAGYRQEAVRIAAAMADRYGRDPRISAWQIDNEYGCHDTVRSYSPAAIAAFRAWCARRYGTIAALNAAWGTVFWSMTYDRFDQIGAPVETVTEPNPAHALAWRRFASDMVAGFNAAQAAALRARTEAPLLHNYMGRETAFDHFGTGRDLDIAAWDSYPIGFLSDRIEATAAHKSRYLRQGDPDMQAFHHDLYRAVGNGRWWVAEQQPGPVNWAPHNPAPLAGMVRLWSWEAFAHGAEAVLYFRWRQAPFGQEAMHAGLMRPDDVPAPGLAEAAQVAREIAELPAIDPAPPAPVAIVFDYASAWAWEVQPQGADFDYFGLVLAVYAAARSLGLSIDILPTDSDRLADHPLVLIPALATLPEPLAAQIAAHPGCVVLGPRSGAKTAEMATPLPLPPSLPWFDCRVTRVESLPPGEEVPLSGGGAIRRWREHLEGRAEVLETDPGGAPLVMADGPLRYWGGWPDAAALRRSIAGACAAAGVATEPLPEGLRLRDTGRHRFAFNYGPDPVSWEGLTLPPAGVAWRTV